ncbi:ATP-binding protein [Desulfurivibrio sp. D14AmB]|uniref:hybrid sensor histidine kinase/response regulator n=1 Tax=Desulfurivibrio sp. D14AmB TaxID=3374370 RepID=UPI00376F01E6
MLKPPMTHQPPRIRSIRTLFLLGMTGLILILSLPLLYSGNRLLDNIICQLGSDLLLEKLQALVDPVDRRYETLQRVGLEDSQVHLEEIRTTALQEFSRFSYMKSGMVMVIGEDGGSVLTREFAVQKDHDFAELFAQLQGRRQPEVYRFSVDGEKRMAAMMFYEPWQNYLGICVSEAELFAPRHTFLRLNLLVLAVVLLIAVLLTLAIRQLLVLPLIRLTDYATRVEAGEEVVPPTGTYLLELSRLRENIAAMVASLHRNVEEAAAQVEVIRKREAELNRAFEELQASEERLAITLQSIGDGVITTDRRGRVMLLNGVASQLTGWSQVEAVGRPLTEVFNIINERSGRVCENPAEKVLASGQIVALENHTLLIDKNGTRRPIADSGAPIRDRSGAVIGVVLVFRDMTEQRRVERELLKIKKLESVGMLAAGIAHDFNNLLTAIMINIELAGSARREDGEQAGLLAEAKKAGLRAQGLTKQLLTFARGGAPVRQVASLGAVIRDSTDFVLRGSGVSCDYQIPADLWPAEIDQGQISQVIQNIVINASQAMGGKGRLVIAARNVGEGDDRPGGQQVNLVAISISDSGPGISVPELERIFDPYYTTKAEGSGLGLAICHSIVAKHDGRIEVVSRPEVGTTFTIFLPASGEQAAPAQSGPQGPEASVKARVLVMDDDKMVLGVARRALEHLGHQVHTVTDGAQAVTAFEQAIAAGTPFDLVIMDLTVPGGMGGQEAVGKLRAIDPTVKVVVASGYAHEGVLANYRDHGFDGRLSKPFLLAELEGLLRQLLRD